MALTTIQVAFLFLQFFPPVVNSDYYPDVGYHLDRWNKQMVAHWLVHEEFYSLVPVFYETEIDGNALKALKADELKQLGVVDSNQRRRLLSSITSLQSRIAETQRPLSRADNYHYHECQVDSEGCTRSFTFVDMLQLVAPRLSILFNGLYGNSLLTMPSKHRFLWLVSPHSAVLHAGLECFGVHMTGESIGRHALNVFGAWAGLLLETIIINLISIKFTSDPLEREMLTTLLTLTAHIGSVITLPIDWLAGWYIPWLRLLLLVRDLYIGYQFMVVVREKGSGSS